MMTLLETGRRQGAVSPLALLMKDTRTCVVWTQMWKGWRWLGDMHRVRYYWDMLLNW